MTEFVGALEGSSSSESDCSVATLDNVIFPGTWVFFRLLEESGSCCRDSSPATDEDKEVLFSTELFFDILLKLMPDKLDIFLIFEESPVVKEEDPVVGELLASLKLELLEDTLLMLMPERLDMFLTGLLAKLVFLDTVGFEETRLTGNLCVPFFGIFSDTFDSFFDIFISF